MTCLYLTRIAHLRTTPVRHGFEHASCSWLLDLADVDERGHARDLPWWLRRVVAFRARDHLGTDKTWSANIVTFLAHRGVDIRGGRITALTNGRLLGHVFNPLTLYWCHDRAGGLAAVIAEVHNTYGQTHAYLLPAHDRSPAHVDKEFYVSPFNDVSGSYRMSVPEPSERLDVTVTLHRSTERPFVATWRGHRVRRPVDRIRAAARLPLSTWLVSARIRSQGVRLWRRLPMIPRPTHYPQEDV